jgi:hypothetical protein
MSSFASYIVERYSELELDGEPCFYPVGGLEVAATPARWRDLGRKQGLATSWGIESALLTPEECVERSPLLDPGKIYGGFFVPSDGIAKAVRACEALARRREEGPRRRLVCLTFEDPNTMVLGNEPVWHGDEAVGYVTSAGYWTGKSIAYAWVPPGLSREGERVEIQYFGERHGATVAQEPLFDATMKRMRG